LVLTKNISLDDDGMNGAASFTFDGQAVVVAADVVVDTEQGNDADGGLVDWGAASLSASGLGRDLTIDTAVMGGTGGAITIGDVNDNNPRMLGGEFINQFTLDSRGETNGLITTG